MFYQREVGFLPSSRNEHEGIPHLLALPLIPEWVGTGEARGQGHDCFRRYRSKNVVLMQNLEEK